jgi:hypothetical protein
MRFVADSSLLIRLYLQDRTAESIERFLQDGARVVSLSALARVEVLNALLRQEGRADKVWQSTPRNRVSVDNRKTANLRNTPTVCLML